MSTHGETSNERNDITIEEIVNGLDCLLKDHRTKIELIENHLVFIREQIEQNEGVKKEFKRLDEGI